MPPTFTLEERPHESRAWSAWWPRVILLVPVVFEAAEPSDHKAQRFAGASQLAQEPSTTTCRMLLNAPAR